MNSKDLRNLAEAYQNIQEEPRRARRRKPNKTVEQIKAEIDARNPTQAGPQTGRQIPGAAPKLEVKPVSDPIPTKVQPPAPKPEFGPNAVKPAKVNKVIAAVKKSALPVGVAGATGLALSGGEGPKKSEDPRRPDGSLPPYTPPRPPADPKPEVKPEPPKEEKTTRPSTELSAAAKDFDKAFAAKRAELKKAGKDPSSGTFTWRGKQYNTKYKGE